jgi:hypothetical protein
VAQKWIQPSLFPNLAFLSRKRKRVHIGRERFTTGSTKGKAAPLGVIFLGQRAARAKISRVMKGR